MKRITRLLGYGALALIVSAIVDQMRRPADERTWTGSVLFFPYDLRIPTVERVLTPKSFGVGWDINFFQVLRRFGILG